MAEPADASSPFPWPPTIYGALFLVAVALAWFVPLPLFPDAVALVTRMVGGIVVAGAIILAYLAEQEFRRAGTATIPTAPTTAIITTGVFTRTRNPIYVAFTAAMIGWALAANSWWFLIVTPFAVYAVTKLAIEREEAYLARKFGPTYTAYKARVRRWL
jgi:protein-S-isoprenylcysteine O-methyltransferase Ste14